VNHDVHTLHRVPNCLPIFYVFNDTLSQASGAYTIETTHVVAMSSQFGQHGTGNRSR
jgi:hypothetical protein